MPKSTMMARNCDEQHDGHERKQKQRHVAGERSAPRLGKLRAIGVVAMAVAGRLGEEGAVPHRLDDDEHHIEQHRDRSEEQSLHRVLARIGRGLGVVRNDQREHRERGDDHEEGPRAREIVLLLPIAHRAEQQRRADHAVQPDHQRGEHRVAGQRRVGLAMQHDGGEQRHLDHGHRQGEHKRAVRLAEPLGDRACMAHGAEGAPHHGAEQPEKEERRERNVVQVAEQLAPEEISERDAYDPRDRRRGGAESSAEPALPRARKHKRLVLIHGSSRLPRPVG